MRSLIKYRKPETFVQNLQDEMNKILEDAFGEFEFPRTKIEKGGIIWYPSVELSELDGRYEVRAQLPGVDKDDIEVEINEDSITIKGETKYEEKEEKENIYKSEFRYGKFMRTLAFPTDVDSSNATAEYKNGVLKISVPKTEEEHKKTKKLEIKD